MFRKEFIVEKEHSAREMGSGDLDVLSTPSLIAFMEFVAKEAVSEQLKETETTVGIEMTMQHVKATAIGQSVTAVAKLMEQKKTILKYEVEAYEGEILIGIGQHTRAIVDRATFMARL